jgi:hypothetical protein
MWASAELLRRPKHPLSRAESALAVLDAALSATGTTGGTTNDLLKPTSVSSKPAPET